MGAKLQAIESCGGRVDMTILNETILAAMAKNRQGLGIRLG